MKRKLLKVLLTIVFVSPAWAQNTISFTEHPVDKNFAGVSTIYFMDIEKDGLEDLVCSSETTRATSISICIWWLRNNGDGAFDVIATGNCHASRLSLWNNNAVPLILRLKPCAER